MAVDKKKASKTVGKELIIVLPPVHAPKWFQGFVDFIREQGVVGIALGLTLGLAAKSLVDSLVANIFNPILALLAGRGSLVSLSICLREIEASCTAKFGYGQFLSDLLSFILLLVIFYFVVKALKLDKLANKKDEE